MVTTPAEVSQPTRSAHKEVEVPPGLRTYMATPTTVDQYKRAYETAIHYDGMVNSTFPLVTTVAALLFAAGYYYTSGQLFPRVLVFGGGAAIMLSYAFVLAHLKMYSDAAWKFCTVLETLPATHMPAGSRDTLDYLLESDPSYATSAHVPTFVFRWRSFPFQFWTAAGFAGIFLILSVYSLYQLV